MSDITTTPHDGGSSLIFKINVAGLHVGNVSLSPTGDCQTYSVSNVDNFINKTNALEIFKVIQVRGAKNQMLINVREDKEGYKKIKELFKADIIIEQSYTSTRNSSMCMFLINTRNLR
jgi:hypothetical protein